MGLKIRVSMLLLVVGIQVLGRLNGYAQWQPTNGPIGRVQSITGTGSSIFAGTSRGVFQLDNSKAKWELISDSTMDVSFVLQMGDTLYAATTSGMYRALIGNSNWARLSVRPANCLAYAHPYVMGGGSGGRILRYHVKTGILDTLGLPITGSYVYTLLVSGNRIIAGTSGGGIYQSANVCSTWTKADSGLGATSNVRFIIESKGRLVAGTESGIFFSSNSTIFWTRAETPLSTIYGLGVSGSRILAGTERGVFGSTDNGMNWFGPSAGIPNARVYCISPGRICYAGTLGAGVFQSSDDGAVWGPVNSGLANVGTFTIVSTDSGLIAGTSHGVFRTSDLGRTWVSIGLPGSWVFGVEKTSKYLLAATWGALWGTTNGGVSWDTVLNEHTNFFRRFGSKLYVASVRHGVFASSDEGLSWERSSIGLGCDTVYCLVEISSQLYAGTERGIYRSADGRNWISSGLHNRTILTIAASDKYLLAGTYWAGAHRSTDAGKTWTQVDDGVLGTGLAVRLLVPMGNELFATTSSGLYVSSDHGSRWRSQSTGLRNVDLSGLLRIGDTLLVGTSFRGVWRRSLDEMIGFVSPPDSLSFTVLDSGAASFRWSEVSGAQGYRFRIATDSAQTNAQIVHYLSQGVRAVQIDRLAYNTKFYWDVAASNALGRFGGSAVGNSFRTKPRAHFVKSISYPASPAKTDYRLVSMPGSAPARVAALVTNSGDRRFDWRAFADIGSGPYGELDTNSAIRAGNGLWLLRRGNLEIRDSLEMPSLTSKGTFVCQLQPGWNIVANPFERPVLTNSLWSMNGLHGHKLLQFVGEWLVADTMMPFEGYYFNNPLSLSLNTLEIPYPFDSGDAMQGAGPSTERVDLELRLGLATRTNSDTENSLGIVAPASVTRDDWDRPKPPLVFDLDYLYFWRPHWDSANPAFSTDFRPVLGEGQRWSFIAEIRSLSNSSVSVSGLERVPPGYEVVLTRGADGAAHNLRKESTYHFLPRKVREEFVLIVGTKAFIEQSVLGLVPINFVLEQNYPNPFNPSTTIRYGLPSREYVTLKVYNTLGQQVSILQSGEQEAGFHEIKFDGANLPSGVYFYRMQAGSFVETKKLLLVR